MQTTLIMIRHGETEANEQKRWYGSSDAPLTERGKIQVSATAKQVGEMVKKTPIDAFFVSPLGRTRKTAAAIAETIQMEPVVKDGLQEFDLGDWEGRTYTDLQENEQLWDVWKTDSDFTPPNGESPNSFRERALATLTHLVETHPDQTVLAVTHGGLVCNALACWIGNGPQEWAKWEPHTCAICILQWDGQKWHPVLVNDTSHLPPEVIVHDVPPYAVISES